jgi:cytochrome c oxidase subunit III
MTTHSHGGEHHRFQAHHFDTGEQQFQAGKLGMWLFLATEILFFSGMFCAYAVFRAHHPEIFQYSSQYLDTWLGMANTLVLLASSLSVAWAVRCAQLNQRAGLVYNLVFTLVCAGIFMGVKAVEYSLKFEEGLLWRSKYNFQHVDLAPVHAGLQNFGLILLAGGVVLVVLGYLLGGESAARRWTFWALGATLLGAGAGCLAGNAWTASQETAHAADHHGEHADDHHEHAPGEAHEAEAHDPGAAAPSGPAPETAGADDPAPTGDAPVAPTATDADPETPAPTPDALTTDPPEAGEIEEGTIDPTPDQQLSDEDDAADQDDQAPPVAVTLPPLAGDPGTPLTDPPVTVDIERPISNRGEGDNFRGMFFSIYYAMTGVHAIHILAGIGVIVWIVARSAAGHFEPAYYGPVEYVGLYWHLVDLIWIYLFPLLYLI